MNTKGDCHTAKVQDIQVLSIVIIAFILIILTDFFIWNLYFKLLINSPKVYVLAYACIYLNRDFFHAPKSRANNLVVLV